MAETIQYIAQEGERWDTVSMKAYGTPFEVEGIILANPNVPITDRLSGGTKLDIPIIPDFLLKPFSNLLPPWKR